MGWRAALSKSTEERIRLLQARGLIARDDPTEITPRGERYAEERHFGYDQDDEIYERY